MRVLPAVHSRRSRAATRATWSRGWSPTPEEPSTSPKGIPQALSSRFGDGISIYGPSDPLNRGGVISFAFKGLHPHDISQILDEHAVCVRAGHHCAKPLMRQLGVGATARASLYLYNDEGDVDALADALEATSEFFLL